MIPYNFNYRIADIDMAKGHNKKGEEYDRKLGAKNGMAELVNIVAGLQKDVKRINDCLTLNGARAYAAKKGPNWQAHEADITGPHGKPDGFKEVFVTDANGNIKVMLIEMVIQSNFACHSVNSESNYTKFRQMLMKTVLHIMLKTSMMINLQILDMQSNQKMLSRLLYSTQYTMQIENKLKLLMHQQC